MHIDRFQFTRKFLSPKTASQIFCSIIDQVLRGFENVQVYFDNILIIGNSEDDCKNNFTKVLNTLLQYNVILIKLIFGLQN